MFILLKKSKLYIYLLIIYLFIFNSLTAVAIQQDNSGSFGHQPSKITIDIGAVSNSVSFAMRSAGSRFSRASHLGSMLQYSSSKKNLIGNFINKTPMLFSFRLWNKLIGTELMAIPHSDSVLLI